MVSSRRFLIYILALVGLFMTLQAASHLLELLLSSWLPQAGNGDTPQDLSLYLATLLVGAPLWIGAATLANRRARGSVEERDAPERRLYLATIFAVTSLLTLFALRILLQVLLAVPARPDGTQDWRGAIAAGSQILIYGAAWLYYARAGWAERSPRAADRAHDFAVYLLAGCSLSYLVDGLYHAVQEVVDSLIGYGGPESFNWLIWSGIAADALAGGAVWGAIWCYDLQRGGLREFRARYLYLVLCLAVPSTLWAVTFGLYEVLRRLLGYHAAPNFLHSVVPTLLIWGAVWIYHWYVVRAQSALADEASLPVGSIAWPRRPALALLALLGYVITMPGLLTLIWLALDVLLNQGQHYPEWWRNRLSSGLALTIVGGVTWLGAWAVLQRAASVSPLVERATVARRRLLSSIVLFSAFPAVGFAIAFFWIVLRALLGEPLEPTAFGSALKYLSALTLLLTLVATHALLLRSDLRLAVDTTATPRVRALVAADAADALLRLSHGCGHPIEVVGQLSVHEELPDRMDLTHLQQLLASLGTVEQEGCDSVLVLVRSDGGSLLRYSMNP